MADRFPYEDSPWGQSVSDRRFWYEGLERFGPENIRLRLAQDTKTSDQTLTLTVQLTPPKGFAEDWLKWHDERRAAAEEARQERMARAAQGASRAAIAAAIAAFLSAAATGIQAWYAANPPAQQTRSN